MEAGGERDLSGLFQPYVWRWLLEAFGAPSPAQVAAWPRIAEGSNTLLFSPTGSGKTLAAFLWCISDLFRRAEAEELPPGVSVLYVSPLKALNNDIQKNLTLPLEGIRETALREGLELPEIRSQVRTGDTTQQERAAMARKPPHILITTPESLYIILASPRFRDSLRGLRTVIVDEIHAVSDNKRGVHLSVSLERLEHLVGHRVQRVGLSATQRPVEEIARFLSGWEGGEPRSCEVVNLGARKQLDVQVVTPVDSFAEATHDAVWAATYDTLDSLVRRHATTLVFANSRYKTERTALRLTELSESDPIAVGAHHGSMSKKVRLEMEDRLKAGRLQALVATSSLELGIDVGSIDLVCQVESPKSVSRGLQRIGRAGHLLQATSKGRLLAMHRDDLMESAVLVRALHEGELDTVRVPTNCLDVLAQQVVGAVVADEWGADALFDLVRRSHCFRSLPRQEFDDVLSMLSGEVVLDMEQPPYPKILWDRVNGRLYPERGARMLAYRSSGVIPDVADYDVYLQEKKTVVGQLDEGFVEELRGGDIFILGSSSWRVLGIEKGRVMVEAVYGLAPTIPYWTGDRDSRTFDLGLMVGRFRGEAQERLGQPDTAAWLREAVHVDEQGAENLETYLLEQRAVTGALPTDRHLIVEEFRDALGQQQVVLHSCFGIRVNDAWAMALSEALKRQTGLRVQTVTVDDGILVTAPPGASLDAASLPGLVTSANVEELLRAALWESPLFASRFRHNAVRSLMVLREYQGRKTPVWLQGMRAAALLEACRRLPDFPLLRETMRECLYDSLETPGLRQVLAWREAGELAVSVVKTSVPSPFCHALLLLGQTGEMGSVPARERRTRVLHLHREILKQILDEDSLKNLLDESAVEEVEGKLQYTAPQRRARSESELLRVLTEVGDVTDDPDSEAWVGLRVQGPPGDLLQRLQADGRACRVPIPSAESSRRRWIATTSFALFRDAFALPLEPDAVERRLLKLLYERGPLAAESLAEAGGTRARLDRLMAAYQVLELPGGEGDRYAVAEAWVPVQLLEPKLAREEARSALLLRFLRSRGPVTRYDILERYGLPSRAVEAALEALHDDGTVARGEYLPSRSSPQWCYRPNLEEIHRLTLDRLRREMEPAAPEEHADFLLRWQHRHPQTQLRGPEGLRAVLAQMQGVETFQGLWETELLAGRVADYDPSLLDRLCYGGEVVWRRLSNDRMKRGQLGFCLRRDQPWMLQPAVAAPADCSAWDDDLPQVCGVLRQHLRERGSCFYDDLLEATGLQEGLARRGIWHLAWTGEATNESYESVRHAHITSGLSGSYDLATRPTDSDVTLDLILRHMEGRRLDPRLGRWVATERLCSDGQRGVPEEEAAHQWAQLLLARHGVVTREIAARECAAPAWKPLRRALVKLELQGKVRRGHFIRELSGEQYALPEAVEALREAKLRAPSNGNGAGSEEPILAVNVCDPANPYGSLYPLTDSNGEEIGRFQRIPGKTLVLRAGVPLLLWDGGIRVLHPLSRCEARQAMEALIARQQSPPGLVMASELHVSSWNGHPIDVSPARHLLTLLGFTPVASRWRGMLWDPGNRPARSAIAEAEARTPERFATVREEEAPVVYDAEWLASRVAPPLQGKLLELLKLLPRILPPECELVIRPRDFCVQYKGARCLGAWLQQKIIWLHGGQWGWFHSLRIGPDTDITTPEFRDGILARYERLKAELERE
ncbi:MAG TPA: ATP-dependent helicase [Armatimonadota bacterium]|jgi:ATP-dependent Lhr-like helicase